MISRATSLPDAELFLGDAKMEGFGIEVAPFAYLAAQDLGRRRPSPLEDQGQHCDSAVCGACTVNNSSQSSRI